MPGMDGEFGFQWNNGKEKEKVSAAFSSNILSLP
jgi:hypothetical protein